MSPKRHLMIRSVALILLLITAYVVWARNFGEGIKGVPALAAISAAFSFAFEWIDHSQSDRIKKIFTHSLLAWPVLVAGYIVMIVLLTLNAPVTVLNTSEQALPVSLLPLDVPRASPASAPASKDKPARFHVWSSPLGRTFRLKVKGYAAKTVDVASPAGLTISPERDLVPQLILLIRPTIDGMIELRSGGSVHVYNKQVAKEIEIAKAQPKAASSILVGAAIVPVPHDMIDDWRLELAGRDMQDTVRANILRAWKTPAAAVFEPSAEELAPHQVVRVELRNTKEEPVQCGTMELPDSSGMIVDFPLELCHQGHDVALKVK